MNLTQAGEAGLSSCVSVYLNMSSPIPTEECGNPVTLSSHFHHYCHISWRFQWILKPEENIWPPEVAMTYHSKLVAGLHLDFFFKYFNNGSKIPLHYWHSLEMATIFLFRQYIYNVSYMKHCWIWSMFHCFNRSSQDNTFVSLIYSETIIPFVSKCENDEVCVFLRDAAKFGSISHFRGVRQDYDYCNIT